MDQFDRLHAKVVEFVEQVNAHLWTWNENDRDQAEEHRQNAIRLIPSVQAIADAVPGAPGRDQLEPSDAGYVGGLLEPALRLQGAIEFQQDLASALATAGPVLGASSFHTWVWEAAESLWRDGHHRQAVHAGATQIDHHLQAKLDRYDVSGTKLAREAFSLEPPSEGRPRLRFSWVREGSEQFKSAHAGAGDFGAGCTLVIRNSAAHTPGALAESVALEHLACLSYWARLIDSADVVR